MYCYHALACTGTVVDVHKEATHAAGSLEALRLPQCRNQFRMQNAKALLLQLLYTFFLELQLILFLRVVEPHLPP